MLCGKDAEKLVVFWFERSKYAKSGCTVFVGNAGVLKCAALSDIVSHELGGDPEHLAWAQQHWERRTAAKESADRQVRNDVKHRNDRATKQAHRLRTSAATPNTHPLSAGALPAAVEGLASVVSEAHALVSDLKHACFTGAGDCGSAPAQC